MKFELETISQIVQGSLHPTQKFTGSTNDHTNDLIKIDERLKRHYRFIVQKNQDDTFTINRITLSSSNHPEVLTGFDPMNAINDNHLKEKIMAKCSEKIPISKDDIQQATLYPVNGKYLLDITLSTEFESLSPFEARFWYYEVLLSKETDRLKRKFHNHIFSLKSDQKVKRYVQNHQKQLETFTEMVLEWIPDQEKNNIYDLSGDFQINDVYKILYQHLETLLTYIEKHFTKYLDLCAQVPTQSKLKVSAKLKEKASFVQMKLMEADLTQAIRDIVNEPLERLSAIEKTKNFTYQKLKYFKKFLLNFYRELSKTNTQLTDDVVIGLLLDVNYNALKFFNYLTRRINDKIESENNIPSRLELLSTYLKLYNQRSCKIKEPRFGEEGIIEQMSRWLKEEIEHYEKMLEWQSQSNRNISLDETESKIKTKMSLNQVIYFLRLQVEVGMITNENKNDIFRALTEKLSTKQKENLSLGSIQNKYYDVESSTQVKVKQLLLEMLERSKQH